MRYLKKEENDTYIYDVVLNVPRLETLLIELERNCFVNCYGERKIRARSKDDAISSITNEKNLAGLPVNDSFNNLRLVSNQGFCYDKPYDAYYEAFYKRSVLLVQMIQDLLSRRNTTANVTKEIEAIACYGANIDFMPFNDRASLIGKQLDEEKKKNIYNENTLKAYQEACATAKLNENYNFKTLEQLYSEAVECFGYVLLEKRTVYNTPTK